MAQPIKNQESISWMTPEQAADFLKQVRESKGRDSSVGKRDSFDALKRPKAVKKDAQPTDLLGM